MPSLQIAKLIFSDRSSQINKNLTKYLDDNLNDVISKGGLAFNYIIADSDYIDKLKSMGIKQLPVMMINEKNFIGIPSITSEIKKRVISRANVIPEKTEEEIVQDYYTKELMADAVKDASGKLKFNDEIESDSKEATERRLADQLANYKNKRTSFGMTDIANDNSSIEFGIENIIPKRKDNINVENNLEKNIRMPMQHIQSDEPVGDIDKQMEMMLLDKLDKLEI